MVSVRELSQAEAVLLSQSEVFAQKQLQLQEIHWIFIHRRKHFRLWVKCRARDTYLAGGNQWQTLMVLLRILCLIHQWMLKQVK